MGGLGLLMMVVGVGLLIALVVIIVMVIVSTRRGTPSGPAVVDDDPWEQQLLSEHPGTPSVPGYPQASSPASAAPASAFDRDALANRDRTFDPTGWDDRQDGVEGTDEGLLGDDKHS